MSIRSIQRVALGLALLLVLMHIHAILGRTAGLMSRSGNGATYHAAPDLPPPDRPPPPGQAEPTPPPEVRPPPPVGLITLPVGEILAGVGHLAALPRTDAAAVKPAQARALLGLLATDAPVLRQADGVLKSGITRIYLTLTEEQKRYIEGHPPFAQHGLGDPNAGPQGDPLGSHLVRALEDRAGVGASNLSIATPLPPAAVATANPQIYREGLLTLDSAPGLALTPAQARAILPYLRDEVRVNGRQLETARRVAKVLTPAQQDRIMGMHGQGTNGIQSATAEAVMTALQPLEARPKTPDT